MYNKFLNKIYSMEYVTNISEKQYENTKEKFQQLYDYIISEYNIPPYITVDQLVKNISNVNVYTILIYRPELYKSNNYEASNNLTALPKNILELYGLPEDSKFYTSGIDSKLCTKIQFSDLSAL